MLDFLRKLAAVLKAATAVVIAAITLVETVTA